MSRAYFLSGMKDCSIVYCSILHKSFMWRTDEVAGQETHCRHIVFTAVSTLVTGPGRLAAPGNWERIALLAVGAFRDGSRA
jgi:hypothetical protein